MNKSKWFLLFKYRVSSLASLHSKNILLANTHMARGQMEFHRAEQGVRLLVLNDSGRLLHALLSLFKALFLPFNHVTAAQS